MTPYLAAMVVFFTALRCCIIITSVTLLSWPVVAVLAGWYAALHGNRTLVAHCPFTVVWTMMYYHTALSCTAVIMGYLALHYPWVPRYATALEGLFIACPLFGFVHERRKWPSVYRAVSQICCTDCTHKVNTGILISGIWFTEIWPDPRPQKIHISAA